MREAIFQVHILLDFYYMRALSRSESTQAKNKINKGPNNRSAYNENEGIVRRSAYNKLCAPCKILISILAWFLNKTELFCENVLVARNPHRERVFSNASSNNEFDLPDFLMRRILSQAHSTHTCTRIRQSYVF